MSEPRTIERNQDGSVSRVQFHGYVELRWEGVVYCPYYGLNEDFDRCYKPIALSTALSIERLWMLYLMAKQSKRLPGEFFECGVHAGGSASFLARSLEGSGKKLHLFDTFEGMPKTDPTRDIHKAGDFSDAPVDQVRQFVGHEDDVVFHKGRIPETFAGLEDTRIAFAHVDVDIYRSMRDCCEFIYPRMVPGGVIVFDDYGQPTCPGAREAIDEYFADKASVPLSLLTTQAIVFKI